MGIRDMTPADFPEANTTFGPPPHMHEEQVKTVRGFAHYVQGGSCDGSPQVVVAWLPNEEELRAINEGKPIFMSMLDGLLPHYLSTTFHDATHPA